MAKKYDLITELYAEGIKEVTETEEQWLQFLNSACRNFRLPFDEQLLVYLQRPEASAVLGMEDWNRKFGRWVKHDSKAIAVFDKSGSTTKLKYYFDVTDTSEGKYKRLVRPVPLWEITEENWGAVQETLRNVFRVSEDVTEFAEVILQAAQHAAEDNLLDYMPDILAYRQDSFLEELDEYSVEVETRKLLSNSIAYMLMVRCGIDSELYLEKKDFRNIRDFHTPELVNLFGTATSDVAEMALAEISDIIRKLQQEQKRNHRTFAQIENVFYTEEKGREIANMERSFVHEKRDIQQAGRLSITESDRTGRTGSTHWEIWLPSSELSERTPLRNLSESSDARETESAFERDTGNSTEQDGTAGNRDDESTERDGRDESQRSDAMGRNGEQHPAVSGGDREDGIDQPLAWYDRSKEDKSLPFFHRDQDIKELLLTTPYLKAKKAEIRAFFEWEDDRERRRDYIKNIFNNEPTELTLQDGRTVGYKTYQNVLHLWEGSVSSRTAQSYYDWSVIADYFEGMRLLGELWDQTEPLRTVDGQFEFLQDLAEEKTSAFSFSQEMVDYVLRSGSGIQHGKFRIYSYFLQGHSRREQEEFLKEEYGMGGRSPILSGTGISEEHSAKGLKLSRGYQEGAPQLLLKWSQIAKRIEELIAVNRYMTAKELEYLPEYEKHILTREIYHFYSDQPEAVIRPYARGVMYEEAIRQIRPQLEEKKRVEQLAEEMAAILANTADFDRKYASMQKTYRDVCEFRDGVFSLFTPIPAEKETVPLSMLEPIPSLEHIEEETEKAEENTEDLAPEGTGYRLKTRFAKFYNLPELMMMFREVADIQTADMLNLPVPEAEYRVISVKPSDMQKEMVTELGERAERVRNGMVNPTEDNMLLITNEGRKLALDQRLVNEMLPDDDNSKVNACVDEVYRFWYDTKEDKLTQLLFCDLSTPKKDESFSVYNDVRDKLVSKGVPEKEIQFIHDANTEVRKKELFAKVRKGDVRILMGSTFKMGAGTNVQDLIIASHDLDCPWRPRDLEQRAGRTIRQGNKNKKVDIIRYVTEGTFDAYLYQVIENKQKIISQIMTSKNPVRAVEDVDATALSYAEIKALAAGNPFVKEKMDLDIQVSKLQLLKQSYLSQKYEMEDKVMTYFPQQIKQQEKWIEEYKEDLEHVKEYTPEDRETFPPMKIQETVYADKKEAGQALIAACKAMKSPEPVVLGAYRGFGMELSYNTFSKEFVVELKGKRSYPVALGTDIYGNITRIDNEIEKIPDRLLHCQERLETLKEQLETAKQEVQKPFVQEEELQQKTARLGELNAMLDMDKKEHQILDVEPDESVEVVETKCKVLER